MKRQPINAARLSPRSRVQTCSLVDLLMVVRLSNYTIENIVFPSYNDSRNKRRFPCAHGSVSLISYPSVVNSPRTLPIETCPGRSSLRRARWQRCPSWCPVSARWIPSSRCETRTSSLLRPASEHEGRRLKHQD